MAKPLSKTSLILVVTLLMAGVIALLWATGLLGNNGRKRTYSWQESYKQASKEPYGTNFLRRLLDVHTGKVDVMTNRLASALPEKAKGSYFFVGEGFYPDSAGIVRLLDFVQEGNSAFIAAKAIPYEIALKFYGADCDADDTWSDFEATSNTLMGGNFIEQPIHFLDTFELYKKRHTDTVAYNWTFFDFDKQCWDMNALDKLGYYTYINNYYTTAPPQILEADDPNNFEQESVPIIPIEEQSVRTRLSESKDVYRWNYIRFRYGKGSFYLHTTPLAFTNYFLVDSIGASYISRAISYLPKGQVFWDENSRTSENRVRNHNNNPDRDNGQLENGAPLKYILSQPALAWAWYILLGMAILFVIFRAKRRQKAIPILEPNTNQTVAYITTIGRMYFLKGNTNALVAQQQRLFLAFVRERYNLVATAPDLAFQEQLARVSGVSNELITKIFLPPNTGTDQDLIFCHQSIAAFKQQCK